jgi:hypothetical protein
MPTQVMTIPKIIFDVFILFVGFSSPQGLSIEDPALCAHNCRLFQTMKHHCPFGNIAIKTETMCMVILNWSVAMICYLRI